MANIRRSSSFATAFSWGNYSWQALGGGHRALGGVRAVFDRLREMASSVD
ncbi:hypothetical protein ACFW9I_36305 [[Kitasatospora] papulosa]